MSLLQEIFALLLCGKDDSILMSFSCGLNVDQIFMFYFTFGENALMPFPFSQIALVPLKNAKIVLVPFKTEGNFLIAL